jgi:hypothetical protein
MTEQEVAEIREAAEAITPAIASLTKAIFVFALAFAKIIQAGVIDPIIDMEAFQKALKPAIEREKAKQRHLIRYERMYARGQIARRKVRR